jgi:hemoglobin/transferrin/lactoferrin receptor protein
MERIFIIFFIFFLHFPLFSQVISVKNSETGEILEGVIIISPNAAILGVTDKNGEAVIPEFILPADTLIFQYLGYKELHLTAFEVFTNKGLVLLIPEHFRMNTIVVSANRWQQYSGDQPARISRISNHEIAFLQPQTSADMLAGSGQVFVQKSQQGGGSPMIRGFATNRLLYVVDGVRMNTAIFRGGNIQNVISLDAFANENSEILFGPGAVMYGSDAIGAVMSFHTLQPKFTQQNEISYFKSNLTARFSSANHEKTGHADFKYGNSLISGVTSITYSDFDHLRMGTHGPDDYLKPWLVRYAGNGKDTILPNPSPGLQNPSEYSQLNLMQKIRIKLSPGSDLLYAFHYSSTSEFARYDRHIRYKNGLPRYGEWDYGPQRWLMHQVTAALSINKLVIDALNITAAWQKFEESRIDRNLSNPIRHIRRENVDALSFNADAKKQVRKHHFFYGTESVVNLVKSSGRDFNIIDGTSTEGPPRYPNASWLSLAAYFQYEYSINQHWKLESGLRYNLFSVSAEFNNQFYPLPFKNTNNQFASVSGSTGILWRPDEKQVLKFSVSRGFRAPNVDDLGKVFDTSPGFVTIPNPNLSPEIAWNSETGYSIIFNDICRLDFTGYITYLQDALVVRPFQLNGKDSLVYNGSNAKILAVQNAAYALIKGVQASIEIKPGKGISLISHYNIQNGIEELENGDISPSRHAAPNFGQTTLQWKHQNITLSLSSQYAAAVSFKNMPEEEKTKPELYARGRDGNPYSPAWTIFNIRCMWKINSALHVVAALENITDLRYKMYSSGIAAAGRNFSFSGNYIF